MESVTPEDLREALIREAKAGNVQAMKQLLHRLLGPPESMDTVAELEALQRARVQVKEGRAERAPALIPHRCR